MKRNTLYNALDGSHGVVADGAKDGVKTLDKRPPIRNQVLAIKLFLDSLPDISRFKQKGGWR